MQTIILKNFLLKATRIGTALALFTPLFLGPFGLNISEYPKAVFFRLIIEAIFILYIFLLLLDKKYLPKISPLFIAIIIFDAILIASSVFGINFYRSFFGNMQRGEGIIMHLHLLVFFIILIGVFSEKKDWLDLFKISVFASTASGAVAVLQQFKIVQLFNMYPPWVSGTMSNPGFFAAYVSLSIFVALFLFANEKNKILGVVWLFLAALNCYALIFSGTRAPSLGAGLGFAVIIFSMFLNLSYRKRLLVLVSALVLCIFVLVLFLNLPFFKKTSEKSVLDRFTEFSLSGRKDIWAAFPPAFITRPLLGWGFESFTFVSDKYMTSGLVNGIYYDRAHNKIIEVLTYSGLVGLASYLSIFLVIFYLILKYKKSCNNHGNKHKIEGWPVLPAFFACYFFQNLFAFDNIGTYILFFLMAGFINNNSCFKAAPAQEMQKGGRAPILKVITAIFVFALTAVVIYEVNIKPTVAAMYFTAPVSAATDTKQIFYGYKKAIKMNTIYDSDLMMAFTYKSLFLLESNYANDFKQEVIGELVKLEPFLQKNIETNCEHVNHSYQYLAEINEQKYILNKNQEDLNKMEGVLSKAMSFNSSVSAYYKLFGELKILQNNYKDGELNIREGCVLDKCREEDLYKKIGLAYSKRGDVSAEIKNLQKALDIYYGYKKQNTQYAPNHYDFLQLTNYVGTRYCQDLNDIENCKRVFKNGMDVLPEYANFLEIRLNQLITKK